jgi:hypothetical protein
MRTFLASGRRRYALLLLLVGAGSLAVMGNSCAPAPTKPPPPTGLSIDPTSHDFGVETTAVPQTFTVTNLGPNTSGVLNTIITGANDGDFVAPGGDNTCEGQTLAANDTCAVVVTFAPSGVEPSPRVADLVVSSSEPAQDGQAVAHLSGSRD